MLVYLVGGKSILTNSDGYQPGDEPYYYGYTTNPVIADRYYEILISKCKACPPSKNVTDMYFIQKMQYDKFEQLVKSNMMYVEEIEAYGNTVMTASDYENYNDILGGSFDEITHYINDGGVFAFNKRLARYNKFVKDPELKSLARRFKRLTKELKEYFSEYNGLEDKNVNWRKVQKLL